jgi:cyclophilin family peptidyl-prolyl cis-trans isomerase
MSYDDTAQARGIVDHLFDTAFDTASDMAVTTALAATPVSVPLAGAVNQEVMIHTQLGDIVIELFADTPATTANFLSYVTSNRYDGSFFHRLVSGFVLQGGGYYYDGTNVTTVPADAPVTNEYSATHPNVYGTIAMARTSDLNSATSQFFFNLGDNSASLTGYAVFGQIISGVSTIATITGLPVYDEGVPFDTLPLRYYDGVGPIPVSSVIRAGFDVLAIANTDSFTTTKSTAISGSLVANDIDLDDASFTVARFFAGASQLPGHMVTLASGAHLTVNADGTFIYDPNHAFDGLGAGQSVVESFSYTLDHASLVQGSAAWTITVTGSSGNNASIVGTDGDDTLTGTAGNDYIDGLGGSDAMHGLGGDDTYYVDRQGDLVYEFPNDGNDTVIASTGYYLYPYVENLTLAASAGDAFGVGNAQDNSITGNEGANTLLGAEGRDTIHAGGGIDIVYGQDGNDQLYGEAGNDFLAGGDGNDVIDGGAGGDSVYGEGGNDVLVGGNSFEFDILVGGDGNDVLRGDSGMGDYDYLYGNAGDDSFYVDTGDDLTFEQPGEGTDTVYANTIGDNNGVYLYPNIENLVLIGFTAFGVGNELNNHITGNAGANPLLGGAGDDVIDGREGNDTLYGQAGADTFLFTGSYYGSGKDVIGDFAPGTDKIDVSDLGFNWTQIQGAMHEYNGSTAIDLGRGDLITLNGVTIAQLHQSDFILGNGTGHFNGAVVPADPSGGSAALPADTPGALTTQVFQVALDALSVAHAASSADTHAPAAHAFILDGCDSGMNPVAFVEGHAAVDNGAALIA